MNSMIHGGVSAVSDHISCGRWLKLYWEHESLLVNELEGYGFSSTLFVLRTAAEGFRPPPPFRTPLGGEGRCARQRV